MVLTAASLPFHCRPISFLQEKNLLNDQNTWVRHRKWYRPNAAGGSFIVAWGLFIGPRGDPRFKSWRFP